MSNALDQITVLVNNFSAIVNPTSDDISDFVDVISVIVDANTLSDDDSIQAMMTVQHPNL